MFDPTVFDNLKVAFENELYDWDNLEQRIAISGRKDTVELSVMEREFKLQFHLPDAREIKGEVRLYASLRNLAAEILEQSEIEPSCLLSVYFYMAVEEEKCQEIDELLREIWEPAVTISQTLSYVYGEQASKKMNTIELDFIRHINEEQMGDIPELVQYMIESLEKLVRVVN